MSMQQWNGEDYDFFNRLIFGDESTFHLSGKVNKTTCVYGEQKNPRELVQNVRDSPKFSFLCSITYKDVWAILFHENTVTGIRYLDVVSEWLLPQVQQDSKNFTLIQDGAPVHWHIGVRHYLDENLP
jgi:hypothetical protein